MCVCVCVFVRVRVRVRVRARVCVCVCVLGKTSVLAHLVVLVLAYVESIQIYHYVQYEGEMENTVVK